MPASRSCQPALSKPPFARMLALETEQGVQHGFIGMCYVQSNSNGRRYIGAQGNEMFVCRSGDDFSGRRLARYLSQFEEQWSLATPAARAVLFDLDGVLIDSMPVYVKASAAALNRCGCEYSEDEIRGEVCAREGEKKEKTAHDLYKRSAGRLQPRSSSLAW